MEQAYTRACAMARARPDFPVSCQPLPVRPPFLACPRLPGAAGEPSLPEKDGETCAAAMPLLRPGDAGEAVRAAQTLLCLRREALPLWGADGEYGAETEAAVRAFRDRHGLGNAPEVDGPAWEALVTGKSAG